MGEWICIKSDGLQFESIGTLLESVGKIHNPDSDGFRTNSIKLRIPVRIIDYETNYSPLVSCLDYCIGLFYGASERIPYQRETIHKEQSLESTIMITWKMT